MMDTGGERSSRGADRHPRGGQRILWLSHIPPAPDDGLGLIPYHLARELTGWEHAVVAPVEPERVPPWFASAYRLPEPRTSVGTLARALLYPRGLIRWDTPAVRAAVARAVAEFRPNIVHVVAPPMASVAARMGGVRVLTGPDAISRLTAQAASVTGTAGRLNAWRTHQYERRVLGRFDAVVFVSEADRHFAEETLGVDRASVISNGIDCEYFHPQAAAPAFDLAFVGRMDYWPNVDAVRWFCGEVLPRLASRGTTVRLAVVGRSPAPEVRALSERHPEVMVTGEVADVRPYLWRSRVVIAPLRYGTGLKNKVLEAAACGRPIVASPLAVEGLGAVERLPFRIATTPDEYVERILPLLDSSTGKRVGACAREFVLDGWSWRERAERYEALYHTLRAGGGRDSSSEQPAA